LKFCFDPSPHTDLLRPAGEDAVHVTLTIFLSKLFSAREKDLDDLRVLAPALERSGVEARLSNNCTALRAEASLRANADGNWYIVFGDRLPA
jgi:hypothetical protein